jgi:hypothetical protein
MQLAQRTLEKTTTKKLIGVKMAAQKTGMWSVQIPIYEPNNRLDTEITWITIDEFETQEEAIEFTKKQFGASNDGTIQLVYEEVEGNE